MVYTNLRGLSPLPKIRPTKFGDRNKSIITPELLDTRLGLESPASQTEKYAPDTPLQLSFVERFIVEAIAGERKRIASDIHDDIGHRLTLALYQLDRVMERHSSDIESHGELVVLRRMLGDCLDSVRAIPWNPTSGLTDVQNLAEAIDLMLSEIPESEFLHVQFDERGKIEDVPTSIATAAIRIAQEAVTNTLKYAKATSIRVRLDFTENEFVLDIEDDGTGFAEGSVGQNGGGHGLVGMRQRAVAAGGTLYIHSLPRSGTRVRFVAHVGQGI